jgi:hypothetical protein
LAEEFFFEMLAYSESSQNKFLSMNMSAIYKRSEIKRRIQKKKNMEREEERKKNEKYFIRT